MNFSWLFQLLSISKIKDIACNIRHVKMRLGRVIPFEVLAKHFCFWATHCSKCNTVSEFLFCSKVAQIEANILWKLILIKSRVDLSEVISVMTLSQFSHDINLKTEHQFHLISQIEISFKLCSQAKAKNCVWEHVLIYWNLLHIFVGPTMFYDAIRHSLCKLTKMLTSR